MEYYTTIMKNTKFLYGLYPRILDNILTSAKDIALLYSALALFSAMCWSFFFNVILYSISSTFRVCIELFEVLRYYLQRFIYLTIALLGAISCFLFIKFILIIYDVINSLLSNHPHVLAFWPWGAALGSAAKVKATGKSGGIGFGLTFGMVWAAKDSFKELNKSWQVKIEEENRTERNRSNNETNIELAKIKYENSSKVDNSIDLIPKEDIILFFGSLSLLILIVVILYNLYYSNFVYLLGYNNFINQSLDLQINIEVYVLLVICIFLFQRS